MRVLFLLLMGLLTISCNDQKIDRLESDMRDIKQSLQRIEILLAGQSAGNHTTTNTRGTYGDSYNPVTKPAATVGRCQAITKKGTQCSRKARSGGYCWQHGG